MRHRLLASAAMLAALSAAPLDAATTYTYDGLGRLSVVNYDNGYQIVYTYDSAGNRTSVVTQSGSGLPPVANNDYFTVNENGTDTFDPRINDTDPFTAGHGTTAFTSASVTYTPGAGYTGKDSFTYTISDGHAHTATATAFATVGGLGPTANADSISAAENTATTYDPRLNDVEPNPPNYALTIASATTPGHGTAVVNGGASITYTPASGVVGNDSFNYTISDGHGLVSTATDSIAVGSAPTAVAVYAPTPTGTAVTFSPLVNDSDPYGYNLTVTATTTPAHGAVAINSGQTLTYTPTTGYSGLDTFTYTISDGHLTASAASNVCVGYAVPIAANSTMGFFKVINQGDTITPVITSDPRSGDTLSCGQTPLITSVTQGAYGTVIINGGGTSVTYTYYEPVGAIIQQGVDSFTYTITDSYGGTATGTVSVNFHVTVRNNN
jgi:large repetitive protein